MDITVKYRTPDEIRAALGYQAGQDISFLRDQAHQQFVALIREYRTLKQGIDDDPRRSDQARQDDIAALRDRLTAAVDTAETAGKDAAERLQGACDGATKQPSDTQARMLAQLEIANGDRRIQLMQQGGMDLVEIAQQAAGDKQVVAALRANASAYLAGKPRSFAEGVMKELDRAETPLLSKAQLAARDVRTELSIGLMNLSSAAGYARELVAGRAEWNAIPAWQQGRSLWTLEDAPAGAPRLGHPQPSGN
jgi:hypothetical protein